MSDLQPATCEWVLGLVDQAVVVTDPAGRILYWNRSAERMLGWSAPEAIGRDVREVLPIVEKCLDGPVKPERSGGGSIWSGEVVLRRRDGSGFPGSVSAASVPDGTGRATHLAWLVSDTSDGALPGRQPPLADMAVPGGDRVEEAGTSYRKLFTSVVEALGASHEYVDLYTAGHQRRVARLAAEIARRIGLEDDAVEGVGVGATLHDIGKVAIPARILTKPAPLNDAEWALMKRHARDGHDIVAHVEFPWPVPTMILQHHERMDGSGYPEGLSGGEISLESQIVAMADTVDVITSHRPYRLARPVGEALDFIEGEEGRRLFRDDVAEACSGALRGGFALAQGSLALTS